MAEQAHPASTTTPSETTASHTTPAQEATPQVPVPAQPVVKQPATPQQADEKTPSTTSRGERALINVRSALIFLASFLLAAGAGGVAFLTHADPIETLAAIGSAFVGTAAFLNWGHRMNTTR